ncbi:MAG: TraB/GumN family protein [Erythrobacter sp.]
MIRHIMIKRITIAAGFLALGPALSAQESATTPIDSERSDQISSIQKIEGTSSFVQDYEPNPAIWRLADDDTIIYIFGTFHVLPAGFRWRTDRLDQIVGEVDELVVEMSDEDVGDGVSDLLRELVEQSSSSPPISERLSEPNAQKWQKLLHLTGDEEQAFDRMPLFLSLMSIGMVQFGQGGSAREYGVETVLEAEFQAAQKPISSIENSLVYFREIALLDDDSLLQELENNLSEWNDGSVENLFAAATSGADDSSDGDAEITVGPFSSEHAWAQGELQDIRSEFEDSGAFYAAMYEILIVKRNQAWTVWLQDRLDEPGEILLAAGAGHFEGDDSVILMLREQGLQVDRIQ